ncbi:porin family protein [Hymenobacter crusticola]|uniref:Outer membrane protein beta-barrel domain-containing protein n=1 Tax=Hymenobacter crusticola TaxID=1770526 RepID=A0A243WDA6_9BACT|nr:porin family protein [Hymenobacter crusticola]OUJ73653.1 hypothetical protein BXP70_11725 [Hymenobacter crusticola]
MTLKKTLLSLLFVGASATLASAQVEIGLKVSPSLAHLSANSPSATNFQSEGSKLRLGGGVIVDYFFGENYAFSTGLMLTGKGGTLSYQDDALGTKQEREYSVQYLELPLTVKLYTNDIAPDTKLYFQVGGSANVGISGKINDKKFFDDPGTAAGETKALKYVIFPDASLLGAFGVEYQVGQSTKLLAGISYHRGLVNIDRYFDNTRKFNGVTIKNNEFALDLGIKF